jgi:hypothetical protein
MTQTCPHCQQEIKPEDLFCPYCGKRTSVSPKADTKTSTIPRSYSSDSSTHFCSGCGSVIEPGITYCRNCGQPVAKSMNSSADDQDVSYSYGHSGDGTYHTKESNWYSPPKRKRPAYHPIEWFFWSGWGLYILLRFVFQILFVILRIVVASKKD